MENFKERINVVKEGDVYVGYSINFPMLIVQADSLEQLETRMKTMFKILAKDIQKTIEQDHPFDLKVLSVEEWKEQK